MKVNKIKRVISYIIGLTLLIPIITSLSENNSILPKNHTIAQQLGWISRPKSPDSLCDGYFYEPKNIRDHPMPPPYKNTSTQITAQGPSILSKTGTSILQKDVRVRQTGRLTKADKAYIFRNQKTGKITHIKLVGHVRMQEHDKLLVSKQTSLNLQNNSAQSNDAAYHITQKHQANSWGVAKKIHRLSNGNLILEQATYSTCSPLKPSWQISAKHITLDHIKERGSAKNVVLKVGKLPILYSPYLSFSINNTRKSGLLFPLIETSTRSGFTIKLPYYWNIAPNYDLLTTPVYFAKRGFQINTLFRYLTKSSQGNLYASYLPNDKEFQRFKNDTFNEFPAPINPTYQPYIDQLKNSQNDRGYFAFNNYTRINADWKMGIQLNYVTDAYYLRDFGATINQVIANQLLNQFTLNYQNLHWNVTLLAQAYQTLHLIDQSNNPTVNQYMRLPELDAFADYPNIFSDIDFNLMMQAVNFQYHSIFPPTTDQLPVGQRYHMRPTLSRSIHWASGYITPSLSLDSTAYHVTRSQGPQLRSSDRNLPIINIDTGLYFDRLFHFQKNEYTQTLEPRLFYLYVPYENQDRYPVYDTQLLPFTYGQLFAFNRFTGFDRLENANQLSFGITSRILDSNNARELLKANVGIGYYIDPPRVCLSPNCHTDNEHWTPIATELTFYPTSRWSISGDFSWDAPRSQTNNIQLNVAYTRDGAHIIGGGYTFVHAQPNTSGTHQISFNSDSALYHFYFAWPLTSRLSTVGYFYYNATDKRPENYFAGIQYDTCCISFRFIIDRTYLGAQPLASGTRSSNQYSTNYIFQVQLKGLGSAGNTNPYAMLQNAIPGYHDPFKY